MRYTIFLMLVLAVALSIHAQPPADTPITVDSRAASVRAIEAYQGEPRTFLVTFRDGTATSDVSAATVWMWWASNAQATAYVTSSWQKVNGGTNGQVRFTFDAAAMNAVGDFVYGVGAGATYRQGALRLIANPRAAGTATPTFVMATNLAGITFVNQPWIETATLSGGDSNSASKVGTTLVITIDTNDATAVVTAGANITVTPTTNGNTVSYQVSATGSGSGTSTSELFAVTGSGRVSVSNSFGPSAGIYFDETGLATGTPLYVESDPAFIAASGSFASASALVAASNSLSVRIDANAANVAIVSNSLAVVSNIAVSASNLAASVSNQASIAQTWAQEASNRVASLETLVTTGYLSRTGGVMQGDIDMGDKYIIGIRGISSIYGSRAVDFEDSSIAGNWEFLNQPTIPGYLVVSGAYNLALGTNAPAAWTNQPSLVGLSNSVLSLSNNLAAVSNLAVMVSNQAALAQAWAQAASNLALSASQSSTDLTARAWAQSGSNLAASALSTGTAAYAIATNALPRSTAETQYVQRVSKHATLASETFGAGSIVRVFGAESFIGTGFSTSYLWITSYPGGTNHTAFLGGESYSGDYSVKLWSSGNDGAGSGLDADFLDGLSSEAFVTTQQWHTVNTGKLDLASGIAWSNALNARLVVVETGKYDTVTAIATGVAMTARIAVMETGSATKVEVASLGAYATNNRAATWSAHAATQSVHLASNDVYGARLLWFGPNDLATNPAAIYTIGTNLSFWITNSTPRTVWHSGNLNPAGYMTIASYNTQATGTLWRRSGFIFPSAPTNSGSPGQMFESNGWLYVWSASSNMWGRVQLQFPASWTN